MLIASEVSHARIAIIADRLVVARTGRTLPAGVDPRPAHSPGSGAGSTRPAGHPSSTRGRRHRSGLPVRGQRTRTNARQRKGKRKAVAGKKK